MRSSLNDPAQIPSTTNTNSHLQFLFNQPGNADIRVVLEDRMLSSLKQRLALCKTPQEKQQTMISAWTEMRIQLLRPTDSPSMKRRLFNACYATWNEEEWGKPPAWIASPERLAKSNVRHFMNSLKLADYQALYDFSIEQGKTFWSMMTRRLGIPFKNSYIPYTDSIVDARDPKEPRWFPGATLNITDAFFQAPYYHTAIIYRKEGSTSTVKWSYERLSEASNRVASALQLHGFKKGDHIAIDMPMNIESIVIFIGVLKMGGTLVSLADSFKEADIELRLKQIPAGVKAIFTQDFTGKNPLYSVVKATRNAPMAIVVTTPGNLVPELRAGDLNWDAFLLSGSPSFESVAMDPNDNLNIIFSSSTSTGKEKAGEALKAPKAIPWKAHTFVKSAVDAHLHHDMQRHKTLCWPTNLGWMMGSFDIAAVFMNQGTLALYDGRPITREFGQFVQDAKVNILGLVPALAEQWEQTRCMEGLDWRGIERFSSTGSPSTPSNYFYLMSLVPHFAPVIEYMGGTEIGGGYITNTEYRPFVPSMFNTPTLGTELMIAHQETSALLKGEICFTLRNTGCCTPPMGLSSELLNGNHHAKYFEGALMTNEGYPLRRHGDILHVALNEQYQSGGRADDGIKINGIKTSSTELEGYLKSANIPGLKDVVVVAIRPPASQGGEGKVIAFAVMTNHPAKPEAKLLEVCKAAIKNNNPQLARLHDVKVVSTIPLTASGKIKRQWLADSYLEEHPGLFGDVVHEKAVVLRSKM